MKSLHFENALSFKRLNGVYGFFKVLIALLAVTLLVGCSDDQPSHHVRRQVSKVKPPQHGTRLYYSGTILPRSATVIASPVDGFVETMPAVFGDTVTKGQTVMRLNSPDIATAFADALVNFLKAKDHLASSDHKLKGERELLDEGIIAKNDFVRDQSEEETAYVEYLRSLNKLRQMASLVGESAAELEKLTLKDMQAIQQALDKKSQVLITAPQAGRLLSPLVGDQQRSDKHVAVGAKISKGQALALIGSTQGVAVHISVNEVDINQLKTGLSARITGDAFAGQILTGKVTRVARADIEKRSANKGAQFPVTIEVEQLTPAQQQVVQVGMSAKVEIELPSQGGVVVPLSAVKQRQGQSMVELIEANGSTHWVPVTTGATTEDSVVILKGLQHGDQVRSSD